MAQKTGIEFAGPLHHVPGPGDRREAIFRDDKDREGFLATLAEACARTGWRVHAWVLMCNHDHLTPEPLERERNSRPDPYFVVREFALATFKEMRWDVRKRPNVRNR